MNAALVPQGDHMVTANDINKQVRYVVQGAEVAVGKLVAVSRDSRTASIREKRPNGLFRVDEYPAVLCEVVK